MADISLLDSMLEDLRNEALSLQNEISDVTFMIENDVMETSESLTLSDSKPDFDLNKSQTIQSDISDEIPLNAKNTLKHSETKKTNTKLSLHKRSSSVGDSRRGPIKRKVTKKVKVETYDEGGMVSEERMNEMMALFGIASESELDIACRNRAPSIMVPPDLQDTDSNEDIFIQSEYPVNDEPTRPRSLSDTPHVSQDPSFSDTQQDPPISVITKEKNNLSKIIKRKISKSSGLYDKVVTKGSSKDIEDDPTNRPICEAGTECMSQDPDHFIHFQHTTATRSDVDAKNNNSNHIHFEEHAHSSTGSKMLGRLRRSTTKMKISKDHDIISFNGNSIDRLDKLITDHMRIQVIHQLLEKLNVNKNSLKLTFLFSSSTYSLKKIPELKKEIFGCVQNSNSSPSQTFILPNDIDLYSCAGLVKLLLGEFKIPLFQPSAADPVVTEFKKADNEDRKRDCTEKLIATCKSGDHSVMAIRLFKYLQKVEAKSETNKVNATNLSTTFAPVLFGEGSEERQDLLKWVFEQNSTSHFTLNSKYADVDESKKKRNRKWSKVANPTKLW